MQNWKFASHSSAQNGSWASQDFEDDELRKFQDWRTVQSGTNLEGTHIKRYLWQAFIDITSKKCRRAALVQREAATCVVSSHSLILWSEFQIFVWDSNLACQLNQFWGSNRPTADSKITYIKTYILLSFQKKSFSVLDTNILYVIICS